MRIVPTPWPDLILGLLASNAYCFVTLALPTLFCAASRSFLPRQDFMPAREVLPGESVTSRRTSGKTLPTLPSSSHHYDDAAIERMSHLHEKELTSFNRSYM